MEVAIQNVSATAWAIAPELGMLVAAALLVLVGSFLPSGKVLVPHRGARVVSLLVGAAVLIVPLVLVGLEWQKGGMTAGDESATAVEAASATAPFVRDGMARVIQVASLIAGLVLLVMTNQKLNGRYPAEHVACLLFIVAGVNLVAAANDLIALFVSLELVSIPTYILLYLSRPDRRSLEAAVKYFLLSVFSSAFLLYGLSLLLGSAGATNFEAIGRSLREPTGMVSVGMLQLALVMVVAGLGFKIASVPFHFYAPDVFEGTTLPASALLAVAPKLAGFVALVRLVSSLFLASDVNREAFGALVSSGPVIFAGLAFLTMTVGNVLALLQTDVRRLLAYSSVAHAGYMLIGLAVPGSEDVVSGVEALVFYLLIYSIMTLGAFGVLQMLEKEGRSVGAISDLNGLASLNPLAALMLAVFLFGLTGLPPTAGFWGKFNLFVAAWASESYMLRLLAVGLAVNAAIAAWYYLRLIKCAYLNPPASSVASVRMGQAPGLYGVMSLCAIAAVGLFFVPNVVWLLVREMG